MGKDSTKNSHLFNYVIVSQIYKVQIKTLFQKQKEKQKLKLIKILIKQVISNLVEI